MKKIMIALLVLGNIYIANAQNEDSDGKNKIAVSGALTSCDTWQMEASYHYMICPYIGLGASIGMWKQYAVNGVPKGQGWEIDENYEETENFYLRPSIHLVSPPVVRFSENWLGFFMEPGFMMNIPYCNVLVNLLDGQGHKIGFKKVSSNNGRWYAFDCKIGLNLNLGGIEISGGYLYSNLDIFALRRNMIFEGRRFDEFYPVKRHLHGGFLTVYYIF